MGGFKTLSYVIVKTDGSFAALVLTCSCFNIHLIPFHNMGEKCSRVARTSVFPYCSVNVKCSLSCDSVYFNDCKKSLKWRGSVCLGSIFTCNLHRGAAVSAVGVYLASAGADKQLNNNHMTDPEMPLSFDTLRCMTNTKQWQKQVGFIWGPEI